MTDEEAADLAAVYRIRARFRLLGYDRGSRACNILINTIEGDEARATGRVAPL